MVTVRWWQIVVFCVAFLAGSVAGGFIRAWVRDPGPSACPVTIVMQPGMHVTVTAHRGGTCTVVG